jgi:hypothetical protein
MSLTKFQSDKCIKIVDKLIEWKVCKPFIEMLDPIRDNVIGYHEIVKEPMSLNEVKNRIKTKRYHDISAFDRDMNLIWSNARLYNGEDSYYTLCAMEASNWFKKKMKHFPATLEEEWMRKMQKVMCAFYQAIRNPPAELLPAVPPSVPEPILEKPVSDDPGLIDPGLFEE